MAAAKPDKALAAIAATFAKDRSVETGGTIRSNALKAGGKIFVMRTGDGKLVCKLPRAKVKALIASGQGLAWGPGGKRIMKEWVELVQGEADSIALAREAKLFVAGEMF